MLQRNDVDVFKKVDSFKTTFKGREISWTSWSGQLGGFLEEPHVGGM